jgi:hypothetical protein
MVVEGSMIFIIGNGDFLGLDIGSLMPSKVAAYISIPEHFG